MENVAAGSDPCDHTFYVVCRGCAEPIYFTHQTGVLDSILDFNRLACPNPDCERQDWYSEADCHTVNHSSEPTPEGTGEVWIHDLLLGLSFRAPARH